MQIQGAEISLLHSAERVRLVSQLTLDQEGLEHSGPNRKHQAAGPTLTHMFTRLTVVN